MADLVRYLRDTGGIVEESGSWRVARGVPEVPRDLPESVQGMIARKIERLDERNRRLLLAASVQGHEFDSAVVAEAVEMDPAEVEERLETLERVHVFVTRGDEHEFPDRTLTLQVPLRARAVSERAVRLAAADAARRAQRPIVNALLAHYGAEAADHCRSPGAALRNRARLRGERQLLPRRRAHGRWRSSRSARRCRWPIAGSTGCAGCPMRPTRMQLELGLQMSRGLALRSVKGWAAPELETDVRARAPALPPAAGSAGAVPGAVEPDVLPRDPRRPGHGARAGRRCCWPRPRRRARAAFLMARPHRRRVARVPGRLRRVQPHARTRSRAARPAEHKT